ncbi:MAG: hypothetical protein ING09_17050 [Roseomonas sp.]|jgi:hypothetical protein|nr:hypothetical protein [Roseomonas sp.]MCA3298518.1 hypothetical protein [Roseomonas sp.]MCA3340982.1 hypothetical protein [Roseomonas sp.]
MSGAQYWQGQSVELRVVFLGIDGLPLAAGGVAFRVKKPDGTLVSVSAQADAAVADQWVGYVVADQAGVWTVKASCTTPRAAVDQSTFTVMASLPG